MARGIAVTPGAIVGAILGGILGLFLAGKYVDAFMPAGMEAAGPLYAGLGISAMLGAVAVAAIAIPPIIPEPPTGCGGLRSPRGYGSTTSTCDNTRGSITNMLRRGGLV